MNRIRWYGPTLVLLLTVLGLMLGGPDMIRRLEWARTDAQITLARQLNAENPALSELSESFRKVARIVRPSVVHIQIYRKTRPGLAPRDLAPRPGGEERGEAPDEQGAYDVPQDYGTGSGWVYDDRGHVVTNYHVVEGADRIILRFGDGSERMATFVGEPDEKTDIAVLRALGGQVHPAQQATDPVEQGDIVFAFGSPFRFEFSVSQGIVSGIGRELGYLRGRRGYEDFIQTDASINPGNSGGPLTNIRGQIVGMNTAIASRSGGAQGVGFAIPIAMVDEVVRSIIQQGRVRRGYLGVYIDDLDPKMARTFGYEGQGVLVMTPVPGSPGEKAGVVPGDIIARVDKLPVASAQQLRRLIAQHPPGARVQLDVFRKGKLQQLELQVGESDDDRPAPALAPRDPPAPAPAPADRAKLLKNLGFEQIEAVTPELAKALGLRVDSGVLVRSIRSNSPAAVAGIGRGQVVTHVMDAAVASPEALLDALAGRDLLQGVRVTTSLNGLTRFVLLEWVQ